LGLALLASLAGATRASAASINYGDFIVGPVTFGDVTESSGTDPVPLYGPPDPFSIGLDFDPMGFVATASGGAADVTDGQLNFTIESALGVDMISVFEAGEYSLVGTGTAATQALAGALMRATVTQINGVDVAPLGLLPVNASVGFNLLANPGVLQPWSLGLGLNVAAQLGPDRATRIEIVIDNQLVALSELASLAFIAKKDFRIGIDTGDHPPVPEPSAMLLLLSGCAAFQAARRRRA
jgi:hypothetical protein